MVTSLDESRGFACGCGSNPLAIRARSPAFLPERRIIVWVGDGVEDAFFDGNEVVVGSIPTRPLAGAVVQW